MNAEFFEWRLPREAPRPVLQNTLTQGGVHKVESTRGALRGLRILRCVTETH